ncbi:hypothetical protein QJS10_CPB19g01266 [Acorus calamus]|uniref:Leucine-rich repeat-containing N-terminal plant-type domain-containing protein n=1 Tax=Acorus calamus TaxID=4465 RepID=A0AAV9CIL8_ACOCL|nr:hypothetical protein QJS10_CPB19g01266 [Acorus calamus]
MLEDWDIRGGDCCNWTGVTCGNSSYQHKVTLIDLTDVRGRFISEEWYPNGSHFGQFMELEYLNLSGNGIAGWVDPQDIWHLQKVQLLDLNNNHLNDESIARLIVPWIHNLTSLFELDLGWNNLKEIHWISNITSLRSLDLSSNQIKDFSDIWHLQNVQELYLHDNNLNDESIARLIVPWIHNLTSLRIIDLSQNQIKDVSGFWGLQNLEQLDLSDNQIESVGSWIFNITSGFWGLQNLENLYLSGNRIESVGSWIFNITSARFIDLSNNTIKYLPSDLCQLQDLQSLDLSYNSMKGNIDTCLKSLYSLEYLDLSSNQLDGSIPNSFQNLENIESLDLSNNHLSGEIPSQLVQLHSLSVFRVSYNNLSGIIPYKDQFCTFNKNSFEGNPDLSEELIEKNCWSMHGTSQTYNVSNNGDYEGTSKVIDNDVFREMVKLPEVLARFARQNRSSRHTPFWEDSVIQRFIGYHNHRDPSHWACYQSLAVLDVMYDDTYVYNPLFDDII